MTKWISVKDALPFAHSEVLVLCGDGDRGIGWRRRFCGQNEWWLGDMAVWMDGSTPRLTVTHWAEIEWPEPLEANP